VRAVQGWSNAVVTHLFTAWRAQAQEQKVLKGRAWGAWRLLSAFTGRRFQSAQVQ
jgi:hypothetical protein